MSEPELTPYFYPASNPEDEALSGQEFYTARLNALHVDYLQHNIEMLKSHGMTLLDMYDPYRVREKALKAREAEGSIARCKRIIRRWCTERRKLGLSDDPRLCRIWPAFREAKREAYIRRLEWMDRIYANICMPEPEPEMRRRKSSIDQHFRDQLARITAHSQH